MTSAGGWFYADDRVRLPSHADGRGHRRSASKINRSSGAAGPSAASAADTEDSAIVAFQPMPTSACLACVRRTAVSSLLGTAGPVVSSPAFAIGTAVEGIAPMEPRSIDVGAVATCSARRSPTWGPLFARSSRSPGRSTTSWSAVPLIRSAPRWCARWQAEHNKARFEGSWPPPPARCTRWWISSPRADRQPGTRQRPPSRRHTKRTTLGGTSW